MPQSVRRFIEMTRENRVSKTEKIEFLDKYAVFTVYLTQLDDLLFEKALICSELKKKVNAEAKYWDKVDVELIIKR